MILNNYIKKEINGKNVYLLKDSYHKLREVSTIIFDCDGVLIDVRNSYDKSIAKTVSYLANNMFNAYLLEKTITNNVINRFRKTGGFNNDWDTTYSILLYIFSLIPQQEIEKFFKIYSNFRNYSLKNAYSRYYKIANYFNNIKMNFEKIEEDNLIHLAEKADSRGVQSIEEYIFKGNFSKFSNFFKELIRHPGKIGVNIINTVFEEIFLGSNLYLEKYKINPKFFPNFMGLLSNEELIIKKKILEELDKKFGTSNLGIVSGRSRRTAEITMGKKFDYFNNEITVFIEDEINKYVEKSNNISSFKLGKPNPHALLVVEKKISSEGRILYIGDSMEDIIMVVKANNITDRFIAGGVYGLNNSGELINMFMQNRVELILESINDLPQIFEDLKSVEKI